jgi:hypothetical protein
MVEEKNLDANLEQKKEIAPEQQEVQVIPSLDSQEVPTLDDVIPAQDEEAPKGQVSAEPIQNNEPTTQPAQNQIQETNQEQPSQN